MAAPVASFYSSIGIRINPQDLRRIDATFKRLETRLRNLSKGVTLNISNITINEGMLARRLRASFNRAQRMDGGLRVNLDKFNVNNARLRSAVNTALYGRSGRTGASQGIRLDRFQVSQRELNSTLRTAYTAASAIPMRINRFSIDRAALQSSMSMASAGVAARTGAAGRGNTIINNYYRSSTNAVAGGRGSGYRGDGVFGDARNLMYAGGGAGFIARSGFGALPFLGGVYGIGALNRANQEIFTTPLTTQAVVQSYGYSEQAGVDTFNWLRGQAQEIGFSYMDAAPDFNQMMSNALGAGLGIEDTQTLFKGFNEYQTAMSVTPYRRKLVNNA